MACAAAHAHRPHIVNCDTFASIAQEAAASRDSGESLQTAQERLRAARRYETYLDAYEALQTDVWTSPELMRTSPAIMQKAAYRSCQLHNDEERRTRELD